MSALSPTPLPKSAGEGLFGLLWCFWEVGGDLFEGLFEVLKDGLVWESKDSIASSTQKFSSNSIVGFGIRCVMDTTVEFNNQPETRRTKICDITPNWFLALKLNSIKSLSPQCRPQNHLGGSFLLPILSSQLSNVRSRHKFTLPKKAPLPRFSGEGLGRGWSCRE